MNEVVPAGEALAAARRWAEQILECSPMSVRASKQAVYQRLDEPTLAAAMHRTYQAQEANLKSQDYIEGPRAFAERRKPELAEPVFHRSRGIFQLRTTHAP